MNCLHFAVIHGHLNLCKALIDEYQFDMYVNDNGGWSTIHYFAWIGSKELVISWFDLESANGLKDKDW